MLIRASLLIASTLLLPAAAQANDPRIRSVFYQPRAVTVVTGRPNIQSTIVFAPDERIENIALGDSAGWQVTPNKRANLLFLKPQQAHARTNMTVVTDQRTYMFDLVVGANGTPALYALEFTYPAPPPRPVEPPKPAETALAAAAATAAPTDLNFHWSTRGAKRLLPRRVFDDGKAVYLAWDAGVPMPAVLSVATDGTEGPVNFSVDGEFVVVDGVPGRLVLRAGRESATLDRAAPVTRAAKPVLTQTAER